jgi:hypothetical protein
MKTKTLYQIVSILALALLFIQCSKSDETTTKPIQTQLSAFDLKINNMINGFKTKLNSDLKSGEIMCTDSAIWYICNTINATYGNPSNGDLSPEKTQIDKISTDLSSYNGSMSMEDIKAIYDHILDSIRMIYNGIPDEDKKFGELVYIKPDTGNNSSTSIQWFIITYSTWGLNSWESFGPNESYYYSSVDDQNNPINPNALAKLQYKFHAHVLGNPLIRPYPGYYWINSGEGYQVNAMDYPYNFVNGTAYSNLFDYYLFFNSSAGPGFHETLCASELNFHLSKMIEFADVILPSEHNINISDTYRCYEVLPFATRCISGNIKTISHSVFFVYGTRALNPNGTTAL